MIKAVIFDAGGVLHRSGRAVSADLMKELGISQETFDDIWRTDIPLLGSGKIDEVEFWKRVQEKHGTRVVSPEENLLGRAFTADLYPHPEVLELAKELKKLGLKISVLSDSIEPHARAVRAAGLYEPFDQVFLSHEIGLRKPKPETFQYALQQLGVEPDEVVFVDNDPKNVEGAIAVGINGIVYASIDQLKTDLGKFIPRTPLTGYPGAYPNGSQCEPFN